ncbi:MAG TPA: ABC transporter ATP-binding protein [Natronosporangium sp.]
MRDSLRAYRVTLALGFRAAPIHATCQLLTGVVMALVPAVLAYGAKLLIDGAVAQDLRDALIAAAVLAGTVPLALVNSFYYVHCVFAVTERASAYADRRLMALMGGTDGLAHHERPDYLDQVQRIREERHRLAMMVNATAGTMRAAIGLAATALLLAEVHPGLLALPGFAVLSVWVGNRSRTLEIRAQEASSEPERLRRHLFELGTAAESGKELRVFGLAGVLLERHRAAADRVLRARNRASWRGAGLQALDGLVAGLSYAGAIAVVLLLAVNGDATPGDVVLVIGLAAELTMTVSSGVIYLSSLLRTVALAKRFLWLERYAEGSRRTVAAPVPVPDRLAGGVELREVSFHYPGTDRVVLDHVSVRLPAGAVVALVGDNGAGKTTLIKLLCDFYQPDHGEILVDGVALSRFQPGQWRRRLSAAFQDYARFEFLARETVGVADLPRIDDRAAVRTALARAGAAAVPDALPHGLESQLGAGWDGGVDLSGGQWQKLALGRGLLRDDPLLVVFDEPTAALDAQTEHALFERFAAAARAGSRHGTITLLVSHRFSTVRMADLIVVLDGGKVREVGDHAQLMATGGLYAELYQLQSRAYQ